MKELRPYQKVKIVALVTKKVNTLGNNPPRRFPQVGDIGTIVEIYGQPPQTFTVECVKEDDGDSYWLCDFVASELEALEI